MNFSWDDFIPLCIFVISLSVFAKKPVPVFLKYFPLYFFGLFLLDIALDYTQQHGIHNTILGNVWNIFEFSFYFFVIREVIVNQKAKRRIVYIILVYSIFAFINLIFIKKNDLLDPINFTIGTVITVSLCIYYFFELFRKTETPTLTRLPSFWIVSGILFNVVLVFPLFALLSFMDSLSKANLKTSMIVFNNLQAILNIISVLTYILYSIGFLCRIRTSKSIL
jgi:hypothetical protein